LICFLVIRPIIDLYSSIFIGSSYGRNALLMVEW
jgi:hypothetical protein